MMALLNFSKENKFMILKTSKFEKANSRRMLWGSRVYSATGSSFLSSSKGYKLISLIQLQGNRLCMTEKHTSTSWDEGVSPTYMLTMSRHDVRKRLSIK